MRLGIFAKTFPRPDLAETLDAVAASGLRVMQFNLALAGGPSLPEAIAPGLAAAVRAQAAERELEIAAVSGTYNMAHPDPAVREDGLRRLGVLLAAAPALGTRIVTLCTGTRDPDDMWRRHPDNHDAGGLARHAGERRGRAARSPRRTASRSRSSPSTTTSSTPPRPGGGCWTSSARLACASSSTPPTCSRAPTSTARARSCARRSSCSATSSSSPTPRTSAATARSSPPAAASSTTAPTWRCSPQTGRDVPLILHGLDEQEVPGSIAFLRRL